MNDMLRHGDYLASVQYSAADEVFSGKIIGIEDLIIFQGTSVRELKKAFKEAVEDYLRTCEKLGKNPSKMYKGSFNIRVSADLHREAALFAAKNDISLNDFVKTAIGFALSNPRDIRKQIVSEKHL